MREARGVQTRQRARDAAAGGFGVAFAERAAVFGDVRVCGGAQELPLRPKLRVRRLDVADALDRREGFAAPAPPVLARAPAGLVGGGAARGALAVDFLLNDGR